LQVRLVMVALLSILSSVLTLAGDSLLWGLDQCQEVASMWIGGAAPGAGLGWEGLALGGRRLGYPFIC
jgi:hypothetical protein